MTRTFICLDLETTSRVPEENEIIEIGIVKLQNQQIIDQRDWCIKPKLSIPKFIFNLTGLSKEDFEKAPRLEDVAQEIIDYIGNDTLVAHNADFDIPQLNRSLKRIGFPEFRNPVLDTKELALIIYPHIKSQKQGALCKQLGIPQDQHHRALDDAIGLAKLMALIENDRLRLKAPLIDAIDRLIGSSRPTLAAYLCEGREEKDEISNFKSYLYSHQQKHQYYEPFKSTVNRASIENAYQRLEENKDYKRRTQQETLSHYIWDQLEKGEHGVIEAGTGIGKTIAYLIPAICKSIQDQAPCIISTKTKLLQTQLYDKDAAAVSALFDEPIKITVLKGKENYCDVRQIEQLIPLIISQNKGEQNLLWCAYFNWLLNTKTGDLNELHPSLYEAFYHTTRYRYDSPQQVPDNTCFYKFAKQEARASHVIITNHALSLTDLENQTQSLPKPSSIIIDEAHTLESVATSTFTITLNKNRIQDLVNRIKTNQHNSFLRALEKSILSLDQATTRLIEDIRTSSNAIENTFKLWMESLFYLHDPEEKRSGRKTQVIINDDLICTQQWRGVIEHMEQFLSQTHLLMAQFKQLKKTILEEDTPPTSLLHHIESILEDIDELEQNGRYILSGDPEMISWIEMIERKHTQIVSIHTAPISCNQRLARTLFNQSAPCICLSATLQIKQSFDFFLDQVGLSLSQRPTGTLAIDTEFNLKEQCQVYVLNNGNDTLNTHDLSDMISRIARGFQGKSLALFTAFETLLDCKRKVQRQLHNPYIEVIAQSPDSQSNSLITKFRSGHFPSILMGVDSFWEGMDIKGPDLSCVIITKLPFHVPTDPIHASRSAKIESEQGNAFKHYSLPLAILKFKQGIGRLLRSHEDRGTIFILDPRLSSKPYGKLFLRELQAYNVQIDNFDALLDSSLSWYHGTDK